MKTPRRSPTPRWLDIEVVDLHFRIKIAGVIVAHSEEYASAAKARRAARALVWAINYRPARLSWWIGRRGSQVRRVFVVRRLWQDQGHYRQVAMPHTSEIDWVEGA